MSTAQAQELTAPDAPATIRYTALRGTLRSFEPLADGRSVYLQARAGDWYLARFDAKCAELPKAVTIGFRYERDRAIGAGSDLVVRSQWGDVDCRIATLSRSAARAPGAPRPLPEGGMISFPRPPLPFGITPGDKMGTDRPSMGY